MTDDPTCRACGYAICACAKRAQPAPDLPPIDLSELDMWRAPPDDPWPSGIDMGRLP